MFNHLEQEINKTNEKKEKKIAEEKMKNTQ